MKINIQRRDIVWSYLGIILSMVTNFLLLPLYIIYMDSEILGLWYVFISVGAIALLFDFGFSITFARNVTYCWSGAKQLYQDTVEYVVERETDFLLLKKIIFACKWIYGVLAGSAFVLLLSFGTFYLYKISVNQWNYSLVIAWMCYLSGILLNLYYSYYLAFLRGVGAIAEANKSVVYARSLQLIITVMALMAGGGILGASLGYLMYGLGFKLFAQYRFYHYKDIGIKLKGISKVPTRKEIYELIVTIWHNAWRDGIVAIANYLSTQATVILCSLYITLKETGEYSIAVQLSTAVAVIASTLYYTYQPAIQEAYANRDFDRLRTIFSKAVTIYIGLYIMGSIGIILIGKPILAWIKPTVTLSVELLVWVCFAQGIVFFRNCYTSYFSCTNRIIYVKSFLVSAVIGVVGAVMNVTIFKMSVLGIIGAQVASQLLYNIWYWPHQANKELKLTMTDTLKIGIQATIKMVL